MAMRSPARPLRSSHLDQRIAGRARVRAAVWLVLVAGVSAVLWLGWAGRLRSRDALDPPEDASTYLGTRTLPDAAQDPVGEPSQPVGQASVLREEVRSAKSGSRVLRGRVVSSATGRPIAGAGVRRFDLGAADPGKAGASTRSGMLGTFVLAATGPCSLEFAHGLYHLRMVTIADPASGEIDLGDIALEAVIARSLRIVDDRGEPVAGARVFLVAAPPRHRVDSWTSVMLRWDMPIAESDARGVVAIPESLPAGTRLLVGALGHHVYYGWPSDEVAMGRANGVQLVLANLPAGRAEHVVNVNPERGAFVVQFPVDGPVVELPRWQNLGVDRIKATAIVRTVDSEWRGEVVWIANEDEGLKVLDMAPVLGALSCSWHVAPGLAGQADVAVVRQTRDSQFVQEQARVAADAGLARFYPTSDGDALLAFAWLPQVGVLMAPPLRVLHGRATEVDLQPEPRAASQCSLVVTDLQGKIVPGASVRVSVVPGGVAPLWFGRARGRGFVPRWQYEAGTSADGTFNVWLPLGEAWIDVSAASGVASTGRMYVGDRKSVV